MGAGKPFTPGQARLLRAFEGGNHDCVFVPDDPFDMRICAALEARGVLSRYADKEISGYELTEAGRTALTGGGE